MGSDESHFNVSLIVRDKVTGQCPQTKTFEEKGKPKQIRTEVLLPTSLTPYRLAKPAHRRRMPSSGDLSPSLEGGCCYARSMSWLKEYNSGGRQCAVAAPAKAGSLEIAPMVIMM